MNSPIISVVMPVYNGEKYLKESIESILNQTFTDFEFIIVNDGSTDKTEEIVLSYDDDRIRYVKNETNLQIVKTLNKGIALAKGKYIARMDADDISLPERFAKQVAFMDDNKDIDVCGCHLKVFGKQSFIQKYPVTHEKIKPTLLFYCALPHPGVLIRCGFFKNQAYNLEYQKAEDYHLWASNMMARKYANIPEVLVHYRIHQNQSSEKYSKEQAKLTSAIKKNLLNEIGLSASKVECEIHGQILLDKDLDLNCAEKWFSKLLTFNEKEMVFDDNIFRELIDELWWITVNNSSSKGLNTFFKYFQARQIRFNKKTLKQSLRFFIRCLLS